MIENIINQYINKLSLDDIKAFALKNNIELSDNEINIIYNYIISDWQLLISNDYEKVFDNFKDNVNINTYNNVKNIYLLYRKKYINYI